MYTRLRLSRLQLFIYLRMQTERVQLQELKRDQPVLQLLVFVPVEWRAILSVVHNHAFLEEEVPVVVSDVYGLLRATEQGMQRRLSDDEKDGNRMRALEHVGVR
ncbi:hypothetical protein J3R30DRAFT_3401041 [Lentinula aciculospora]|uniref:Uncharacterized protein n=1 Tax=Lentinula aciculospora TaxID=153920 RepID=A0A9W9AR27_9AGAR|nr:hypothetical protein J3R30DRAFT_3401041 [Lentinula aciculospora]